MPYRIGLVAYPLFLFFAARQKNSAAAKLLQAGAVSPETARRPSSLGLPQTLGLIASGVKSGVLTPTGDGRYYVNVAAYRRRRNLLIGLFVGGSLVFAGLVAAVILA